VATGSDKRLTPAQRKKAQARYRKSGRRKDPATDLVLGAASMVPVAGVGARAAGVARAAQAAKKATMKVKEPKSNVKVIKKPRQDPSRPPKAVKPYPKKKGAPKYRVDEIEKAAYRDAMRKKPVKPYPKKKAPAKKKAPETPAKYSAGSGKLKRTAPMTPIEIATTLSRLGYKRSPTGLEGAYKRYNAKGLNKKR
jgi:hypothetical protein